MADTKLEVGLHSCGLRKHVIRVAGWFAIVVSGREASRVENTMGHYYWLIVTFRPIKSKN